MRKIVFVVALFVSAGGVVFADPSYWLPTVQKTDTQMVYSFSVEVPDVMVPWHKRDAPIGGGKEITRQIDGRFSTLDEGLDTQATCSVSVLQIAPDGTKTRTEDFLQEGTHTLHADAGPAVAPAGPAFRSVNYSDRVPTGSPDGLIRLEQVDPVSTPAARFELVPVDGGSDDVTPRTPDAFDSDQSACFRHVDGLAGQGVSFEAAVAPDRYLLHSGFILQLALLDPSELFRLDATFLTENDR